MSHVLSAVESTASAPIAAIGQFPPPIYPFVGRDRELSAITHLVESGIRVIEIIDAVGQAHNGKTAIALQIAHQLTLADTDLRLYANLQGQDTIPRDSSNVMQQWLVQQLGQAPETLAPHPKALAEQLKTQLGSQSGVMVLDDVASLKQVEILFSSRVLAAPDRWVVLITGRNPVLTHQANKPIFVERLSLEMAHELMQTMLQATTQPLDDRVVQQLIKLTMGNPLLVRLLTAIVAQPMAAGSPEQLMLQIQKDRLKLMQQQPEVIANSLACLSVACRTLSPEQRNVLSRLSVLRGDDFSADLVTHLVGQDAASVQRLLQELVAKQWIGSISNQSVSDQPERFVLTEQVRSFLWEKVTPQARQTLILSALAWHDQQAA
jgi:NB-ARC domain